MSLVPEKSKLKKAIQNLIILYDDINFNIGYLMGLASEVDAEKVNFMTKVGKGLIYVCITEEKAKELNLPIINNNRLINEKTFTVSVDFKTTTTGISAYERSDTIHAFTNSSIQENDFKRPGHIFPLISYNKGLQERTGIAEGAVALSKWAANETIAYLCEVLNERGDIASLDELKSLASDNNLTIIALSELVKMTLQLTDWLEIVSYRKMTLKEQRIDVFIINNQLNNSDYIVYVKRKNTSFTQVIHYKECLIGEQVEPKLHCSCEKHFKHHFEAFITNDSDCLVFEKTHSNRELSKEEREVIEQQLKDIFLPKCMGTQKYNNRFYDSDYYIFTA